MPTKFNPATEDAPTLLRPSNHLLSPNALEFGATILGVGPNFPRESLSVPPSGDCKQPSWIQPEDFDPEEWPTAGSEEAEVETLPDDAVHDIETATAPTDAEAMRAKTDQFDAKAYWELMEFDTLDRIAPISALVRAVRDPEETFSEDVDLAELENAAEEVEPTAAREPSPVTERSPASEPAAAKKRSTEIVPLKTPLPRSESMPSIPPEGIDRCTWNPSGKTAPRGSRLLLAAVALVTLAAGSAALLYG